MLCFQLVTQSVTSVTFLISLLILKIIASYKKNTDYISLPLSFFYNLALWIACLCYTLQIRHSTVGFKKISNSRIYSLSLFVTSNSVFFSNQRSLAAEHSTRKPFNCLHEYFLYFFSDPARPLKGWGGVKGWTTKR